MSIYGISTPGKDGTLYRSQFEASFCNKFLYKKFKYIYEPPYNDGTKSCADFYIEDINIWIECVYHEIGDEVPRYAFEELGAGSVIDLNVPYAQKELAKRLGAFWNNNKRIWQCQHQLKVCLWGLKNAGFLDPKELKIVGYYRYGEDQITEEYNEKLVTKVLNNRDKDIVTAFNKDIDKRSNLFDLIRVRNNDLYQEISRICIQNKTKIEDLSKEYV